MLVTLLGHCSSLSLKMISLLISERKSTLLVWTILSCNLIFSTVPFDLKQSKCFPPDSFSILFAYFFNFVSVMQISEIKVADIPDVDLSRLGVTEFRNFSVEVVDPVSDYLELLEVGNKGYASLEFWDGNSYELQISNFMGFCAECIWFRAYQKSFVSIRFQVSYALYLTGLFC